MRVAPSSNHNLHKLLSRRARLAHACTHPPTQIDDPRAAGLTNASGCDCHGPADPLLDDSVMFTRRLKALGRESDVRLKVAPLLPHGWLNMYFTGDQGSMSASTEATCWMKQMLQNGLGEVCRAEGGAEGAAFADAAQHAMTEVEGALWMPGEGLTTPSAVRSALRSDSEAGSDVSPSTPSDRVEVDWARGDVFLSGAPRA